MAEKNHYAVFESGELYLSEGASKGCDVVLAVPLSRILAKIVRVPISDISTAEEAVLQELKEFSPFPDDELAVSKEMLSETQTHATVLFAALPESVLEDVAEKLDEKKLSVVKIDLLALVKMHIYWPKIHPSLSEDSHVLVLEKTDEEVTAILLEGSTPIALRSFSSTDNLRREVMLTLLEAESVSSGIKLEKIYAVNADAESLNDLAAVENLEKPEASECISYLKTRTEESSTLDVLPNSWREILRETKLKSKAIKFFSVAGGIWLLCMVVLFGVPFGLSVLADNIQSRIKAHRSEYASVKETRDKVMLIEKYSDHSKGALEVLRAASACMPDEGDGFILTGFDFRQGEDLRISGESDERSFIFDFKDSLSKQSLFPDVQSPSIKQSKDRYAFTIIVGLAEKQEVEL
jgi:Tfp pilus assembly PilM family ATPase